MRLRMWSYDLAREQTPTFEHLQRLCRFSLDAGYNAIGLYLEHRFAYPSAPWARGLDAVEPDVVRNLQQEFRELQIIPLVNLLGHMEGFLYTEPGAAFAEARFKGLQGCPSNSEFRQLCGGMIRDVLECFDSELIHIGGDETAQLGSCPTCADRVASLELAGAMDGKAVLYGEHFAEMADLVTAAGRRPAVWGDMLAQHPAALEYLPKQTVIFDWQYFSGPTQSSNAFGLAGYDTVFCPALHTYNATWLHLPQSEENVRVHASEARATGAMGVCVTTWEGALFGNYETLLPALRGAARLLDTEPAEGLPTKAEALGDVSEIESLAKLRSAPEMLRAYRQEGELYEAWARLMGVDLQDAGGLFGFTQIRSALKCRLLLYSNPFLLWLRNRDELLGESGTAALLTFEHALSVAPDASTRGVAEFGKAAIEFVRHVEESRVAYSEGRLGDAQRALAPCRQIFDNLAKTSKATQVVIGGSRADLERCRAAKEHVERVIRRLREFGDGSLGYMPAFEALTHPKFMPHDQGCWWLINQWANE